MHGSTGLFYMLNTFRPELLNVHASSSMGTELLESSSLAKLCLRLIELIFEASKTSGYFYYELLKKNLLEPHNRVGSWVSSYIFLSYSKMHMY